MPEKIFLQSKRDADQRLALLALALDEPVSTVACLDAEEMALLVEDRMTAAQAESLRVHLAGCESCYREWLLLSREQAELIKKDKSTGRPTWLRQPLAKVVPALALAAGIIVFLTVSKSPEYREATLLQDVVELPSPSTDYSTAENSGSRMDTFEYQENAPSPQIKSAARMEFSQASKEKKKDSAPVKTEQLSAITSLSAGKAVTAAAGNMEIGDVEILETETLLPEAVPPEPEEEFSPEIILPELLSAIQNGCDTHATKPLYWRQPHQTATRLLKVLVRQGEAENNRDAELLRQLLPLLWLQRTGEAAEGSCMILLSIVDQHSKEQ